jgi:hypothetical protein
LLHFTLSPVVLLLLLLLLLSLQEFLSGLAVLRQDFTNSTTQSSSPPAATEESGVLMVNARLTAYESALALLSRQLAGLVAGAAAVKGSLRQCGLLPSDGSSIREALQQAAADGRLAEWANQGVQQISMY